MINDGRLELVRHCYRHDRNAHQAVRPISNAMAFNSRTSCSRRLPTSTGTPLPACRDCSFPSALPHNRRGRQALKTSTRREEAASCAIDARGFGRGCAGSSLLPESLICSVGGDCSAHHRCQHLTEASFVPAATPSCWRQFLSKMRRIATHRCEPGLHLGWGRPRPDMPLRPGRHEQPRDR